MLITKDGFAVLASGRIDGVTEAFNLESDEAVAIVAEVSEHDWSEAFAGCRIELDETRVRDGEDGPFRDVAYLTVTIPLRDDAALTAAYRLRDRARGSGRSPSTEETGEE